MSPSRSASGRTQALSGGGRAVLTPTPPYSFRGSFFKPSHFRTADCAEAQRTIWHTVRVDGEVLGVRLAGNDNAEHPTIRVGIYGERGISLSQQNRVLRLLERRYDMGTDITPFLRLVRRTSLGRPVLLRWMGTRSSCAYSLYELLVVLVCLQNTHVRRTEAMMQHLFEGYGQRVTFSGHSLWSFWAPAALVGQEARLRELRLGYRARTLEQISRYFDRSSTDYEDRLRALPDKDLATSLQEIPGVGPATAGSLLFEYFHRYDSLAYLPPWETKIFRRLFEKRNASQEELVALAHRTWPGYANLALHILLEDQFWRMREHRPNLLAGLVPPM